MRRTLVLALVGASLLALPARAGIGASGSVWFLRDGEPVVVERHVRGVEATVRALLAGPTARERRDGIVTALPAGVAVRAIDVRRRIVTVDLAARVTSPARDTMLRNRVRQLVRTIDGVPGVVGVRLRVEGGVPLGLFGGFDVRGVITASSLRGEPSLSPAATRQRLDELGFMPPAAGDPADVERLQVAILAFEKWAGLERDGVLARDDARALRRALRPDPIRRNGRSRRIEVLLDRQVALLIDGGRVVRVVHVSTGGPGTSTPSGSFRIVRKERYSWSVPFRVWMPWASYFTGSIAFHEFSSVPAYAASHGCVRVNRFDAPAVFAFAVSGTPVDVLGSS